MQNNSALKEFQGKRVHILGVAGTLMGSFAALLKRSGVFVTGSDQNIYPPMSDVLKNAGIEVYTPYSPENLEKVKPDLVIVGNVVKKINPEMSAVLEKKIAFESLPSALEKMVLPQKHPIVVSGTHGKTTASSMMAWLLEYLNEKPSFFVGGVLQNFPESFRITDSKYMVLEGDEYDTAYFDKVPKFTHYRPKDIILTSVEYDHADIYPDMTAVLSAFEKLAKLAPEDGFFVACSETETPLRIAHKCNAHVISYGLSKLADSRASGIELSPKGAKFKWHFEGHLTKVELQMSGIHNVLNALGVLTLAAARQFDPEKCAAALAQYKGVKRRQEVYGVAKGVTIIDDFAHHPTAVRETINAIRGRYPESRLIACFEPRSATSRRKVFQAAYAESFDSADYVYLAKPFEPQGASAPEFEVFSTEEALNDLKARGKRAKILLTSPEGIKDFSQDLKSGDVVLVMSNGGFDGFLPKLMTLLTGSK
ncbi:MAG: UDP-N-acetylmuramate--L-alanine ligase [Bacteriovoracia bacterium]